MRKHTREDDIKAFWSKIEKRESDQCWPWLGAISKNGYGQAWFGHKQMTAPRVMYFITHGRLPKHHHICHGCDNRWCVNPGHLWVGTASQNILDAYAKGRKQRGIDHYKARLSEDDVKKIRFLSQTGTTQLELADMYRMHQGTISNIIRRKSWKHL